MTPEQLASFQAEMEAPQAPPQAPQIAQAPPEFTEEEIGKIEDVSRKNNFERKANTYCFRTR